MADGNILSDLKRVRRALGRTQTEMAELLAVSTRAVQSYEQGWRPTPCHVQQMAGLLMFLDWRKSGNRSSPCWRTMDCPTSKQLACPAYQFKAGDICWLMLGTRCSGRTPKPENWDAKIKTCLDCDVMKAWLPK